ncbi:MAG: hypothetical protein ACJA2S_000253 [Cyclobacteriaceae bacterium]|jgi:hypothetical protein
MRSFVIILTLFLASISICNSQHFVEVAEETNLNINTNNNGNAIADYDQDGDLDVFMVSKESFDANDPKTWSRLLNNNGKGSFDDVTISAGFGSQYANPGLSGGMGQKMGVSWGDYDKDGYPDLLLTHFRKVELYRNKGDGTFTDVTETSGIRPCPECYNSSALWWDYDNDGDIDLYISDWQKANRMYKNEGDGNFQDITRETGLGDIGNTWTSMPIDANRDGWLDLYVVNDFSDNRFYVNKKGEYFEEATKAYGLENSGDGMGVTTGDYNNDGFFDIFLTNIANNNANPLFTATHSGRFEEQGNQQGVDNAGWAWGTHFFDCDLDGDEDLYVTNGYKFGPDTNRLFRNLRSEGTSKFTNWSSESKTNGSANAMSMEIFDYDEDGDLDILVSNTDTIPYFYRNETISSEHSSIENWLKIKLEGTTSNRDAIGTILELYVGKETYHRFYHGAALLAQSLLPVHFGLDKVTNIDSLIIKWPSGIIETVYDITSNQTLKLVEKSENLLSKVTSIKGQIKNDKLILLKKNFPNPFSESTTFEFEIMIPGSLTIDVFSSEGKKVFSLSEFKNSAGTHNLKWSINQSRNQMIQSGLYIYQIQFEGEFIQGKLMVGLN